MPVAPYSCVLTSVIGRLNEGFECRKPWDPFGKLRGHFGRLRGQDRLPHPLPRSTRQIQDRNAVFELMSIVFIPHSFGNL